MKVIVQYLAFRRRLIGVLLTLLLLFCGMGRLCSVSWENILYFLLLCVFFLLVLGSYDCAKYSQKRRILHLLAQQPRMTGDNLPQSESALEQDYQDILLAVLAERTQTVSKMDQRFRDMTGYYTLWTHQIKTPLAAINLLLQQGEPDPTELKLELQRVERYVDMALQYQRLDSDSSDYVIRRCRLDEVVRPVVRKFAAQFIRKHLTLNYEPLEQSALTDEKWLAFVVEQLLSNAVKYTPAGGTVSIRCEEGPTLVISDTGIGIEKEDLPRVFDCGFTGYNGRADKKATGIGLYLCSRVCKKLGHGLRMESQIGEGSSVCLTLSSPERVHE